MRFFSFTHFLAEDSIAENEKLGPNATAHAAFLVGGYS